MATPADAVVLIGPMGAGKTSVGRRVAKLLGRRFTDTDTVVVRAHGPIDEIFAAYGEAHFRDLERAAVAAALADGGIVSLGGGAVLDADTRAALAGHRVVLLTVEPRVVASRVRGSKRPLLGDGDGDAVDRWNEIYQARRPVYEQLATVVFDTSRGPLRDVVGVLADWVRDTEANDTAANDAGAGDTEEEDA